MKEIEWQREAYARVQRHFVQTMSMFRVIFEGTRERENLPVLPLNYKQKEAFRGKPQVGKLWIIEKM